MNAVKNKFSCLVMLMFVTMNAFTTFAQEETQAAKANAAEVAKKLANPVASLISVYLTPIISGVTKLGTQIVSWVIGPRIPLSVPYANRPDFGVRAQVVFVFPK
jgi:dihydrodipicolinate synthase/N-acetylneuraminate lyase